ncbi:TPA: hypothetical protein ACU94I_001050 [Klebsiella aerogenes]|uniref:hypothetical protein n=1 Tax=Klebsiella aerogenes TaxID=548 RepID=UPI00373FC0FE
MLHLKDFLKHIDTSHLHEKISKFRDLDFKRMSYQEVQSAINKVITFNTPQGNICVLTPMSASYPAGTRFYRVRSLPEDDKILPLHTMSKVVDCWEPPEHVVQAGRLNRENESLLYTAPILPFVAVEEMKINDNQLFSLIVYEALEQINVTMIGQVPNVDGLNSDEALKARMLQDFLRHEFIRDVGVGTEYLYRISESIAKDYFDLPPDFQDAWCYPSVAKKGHVNVCFRKGKRDKLKFIGTQITSIIRQNENYSFHPRLIATTAVDGSNLSYYKIGSEIQRNLFPEIMVQRYNENI